MGKHAYLIMAHKNDFTFHTLISLLDNKRNDIFIHMDKKVKNYDAAYICGMVHQSRIFHTPKRLDVRWGGYSLIENEMNLLETALNHGHYDYYHLLSGEDLPIKTQDEIHAFFDNNQGCEFVQMQQENFSYEDRVRIYHFFQDVKWLPKSLLHKAENSSVKFQQEHGILRNCNIAFQKGSQWFSITNALASYVIKNKEWIKKVFGYTVCGDEVFLQTLVHNSFFREKMYHKQYDDDYCAIVRHVDWSRGSGAHPHTFTVEDYEVLKNSPHMFARKFDCNVDKKIITYVAEQLAVGQN